MSRPSRPDAANRPGITPLVRALRGDRAGNEAVRLAAAFVRGRHADQ